MRERLFNGGVGTVGGRSGVSASFCPLFVPVRLSCATATSAPTLLWYARYTALLHCGAGDTLSQLHRSLLPFTCSLALPERSSTRATKVCSKHVH
jgi:hypothetical protein